MKTTVILFSTIFLFCSCQKDLRFTDSNPIPPLSNCLLTKTIQGIHNDTVCFINYDSKGRINSIQDSTDKLLFKTIYDTEGRLTSIKSDYSEFTIAYRTDGKPDTISSVEQSFFGSQYIYKYGMDGTPVKRIENYYDNGKWLPYIERRYSFANGDIVQTKEYDMQFGLDTTMAYVTDYTYTSDVNVFQSLAFFSEGVYEMGLFDMLEVDFYFNKHLFKSNTTSGTTDDYSVQYSRDSTTNFINQVSALRMNGPASQTFTHFFFYQCK